MTVLFAEERVPPAKKPARNVVFTSEPEAFTAIEESHVGLVIWRRELAGAIGAELRSVALGEVDDLRFVTPLGKAAQDLLDQMRDAGYPGCPALIDDIVRLAKLAACPAGASYVRIRLEVVENDACRKFHADYMTVRTITTYAGLATQWIESGSAEGAGTPDGPVIEQLAEGDVAMFKGRLWQKNPNILHRSPPIAGLNEQRLVLVIDPMDTDCENQTDDCR